MPSAVGAAETMVWWVEKGTPEPVGRRMRLREAVRARALLIVSRWWGNHVLLFGVGEVFQVGPGHVVLVLFLMVVCCFGTRLGGRFLLFCGERLLGAINLLFKLDFGF